MKFIENTSDTFAQMTTFDATNFDLFQLQKVICRHNYFINIMQSLQIRIQPFKECVRIKSPLQ